MNNIKKYNLFILISTFARSIIELFSIVILYKLGFSFNNIIIFYIIYYLFCAITSSISLSFSNKINPKYILIFSSMIYAYSFYYLSNISINIISLIIFAILLATGNYTYHPIRHLYALKVLDKKNKGIASILIYNYIAITLASYLGPYLTNKIGLDLIIIILIITSIFSIIPLLFIKNENKLEKIKLNIKKLPRRKLLFFICEQFKVIFLLLQPLYLYLYVNDNIEYVGMFNAILGIASIVTIYLFSKTNNYKFFIINLFLCLTLIFKINITNPNTLLMLAILEGIGIKIFEVVSTKNIYNIEKENTISYLILVELIFCLVSTTIFIIFYFINNLKNMLYICIFFIFLCGIINPKIDNQN